MKNNFLVLICAVVLSMTASSALAGGKKVYCFFSPNPDYLYEDDNVQVGVYDLKLIVRNKTDHVIYLDKETSFAYLNDRPTCLFSNAITTNSTSQGSNTNVNLGGVARAMGVGGGLGALMSGIDVGGNQTQGSSTTTVEQKIVTIAPQSAYVAYKWESIVYIMLRKRMITRSWNAYIDPKTKVKTKFKKGTTMQFDEYGKSPVRLKGVINYYPDKDAQEPVQATVSNYLSNIVVDEATGVENAPLCAPYKAQDCQMF